MRLARTGDPAETPVASTGGVLTVDIVRLARRLAWIAAALIVIHVALLVPKHAFGHDHLLGFAQLFDVETELSVPAWFSSALLLLCAGCLWVVARSVRAAGRRFPRHWMGLATAFLFLSLDEASGFHERFLRPMRAVVGSEGPLFFAWVVPYTVLVAVLGATYLRFLFHLPAPHRWSFVIAGAVYVGGALGFEMLGGMRASAFADRGSDPLYLSLVTVEEALEMGGLILFLRALGRYFAAGFPDASLRFRPGPSAPGT